MLELRRTESFFRPTKQAPTGSWDFSRSPSVGTLLRMMLLFR
jgi:hypothetical protein